MFIQTLKDVPNVTSMGKLRYDSNPWLPNCPNYIHRKLDWKVRGYFAGRVISQSSPYIFWIYTAKSISRHFSAQKVGINYQTVFSFSVLPNDAQESNVPFFENFWNLLNIVLTSFGLREIFSDTFGLFEVLAFGGIRTTSGLCLYHSKFLTYHF